MAAFAARYARAFAQVASATHLDLAAAQQQLRAFAETLTGSRELREVLMNPSLPNQQKLKVIDAIAQRLTMSQTVRNFVAVIMDHQRLSELDAILAEYAAVADTRAGLTEVEIISARPLDEKERNNLASKAGELAGGRVNASFVEDPSLLGGAVLKIGSTIYDGSLKAQLAGIKQRLAEARVS
jgi:F-type H+-transporting ATPase subunit delta